MEVTCERCHTDYEFDDALVSEQGTSVRCTQCGFKFRVKRETGNAPEIWVVRTVDGRELEFRALRELKGAITTGRIGRDDVLSRGVGRPRRLASIAELEPFFAMPAPRLSTTAVGLGESEARPRSRTPHGLGPYVPNPSAERQENSVAFSLPKLAEAAALSSMSAGGPGAASGRRNTEMSTTSVVGTPLSAGASTRFEASGPDSIEPETAPRQTVPRRPAPQPPAGRPAVMESQPAIIEEAGVTARNGASPPSDPAALAASMHIEDEVTHAKPRPPRAKREAPATAPKVADVVVPAEPPPPTSSTAMTGARSGDGAPETPAHSSREAVLPPMAPEPIAALRDDGSTPRPPPVAIAEPARAPVESEPPPPVRPPRAQMDGDGDSVPPRDPKLTPTPAELRFSITSEDTAGSDPRFTSFSSRGGSGSNAARLLVGFVLLCAVGFGVLLGVRYLSQRSAKKADASSDDRITGFITESDKLLREGDVDAASDQLVEATALSDADPRVARAMARIANVRAEMRCLRADILLETDAERETAVSECGAAASKAEKAVDRALSFGADDPEAIRAEIDQKRLAGDVASARKLVARIATIQSQPETARVLAALDLHGDAPPWQSVFDRLSLAATAEGDLGRARALLVYALARSGDVKAARAELDKIARMSRPHPLKAALTKFLDRAEKGEMPAARVDDLPSASAAAAPIGSGKLPTSANLLGPAHEALARHDLARAEQLYQQILDKEPNNTEALAGLAAVARAGGNLGRADALYKRSLEQNDGYIPSLVSAADLKWETGQKDAAADLYARLLELDPNGPDAARARSRIAQRNAETASKPEPAPTGEATSAPATQPTSTPAPLPSDVPLSP